MGDQRDRHLAVHEWGASTEPGILLWPGLGSSGAYFASIAGMLPDEAWESFAEWEKSPFKVDY